MNASRHEASRHEALSWFFSAPFDRDGDRALRCRRGPLAVAGAIAFGVVAQGTLADPPPYEFAGSFTGPAGTFDVLPDGRIIAVEQDSIVIETSVGSGQFTLAGLLPPGSVNPFGASFISVSPDGSRIAIGDGETTDTFIHVVNIADLNGGHVSPMSFAHGNYDASWLDANHLGVSWADPATFAGRVSALDILTGESDLLVSIDGASAGVTFTSDGDLLTGNGFDFGGVATGEVRAFDSAVIRDIIENNAPALEFDIDGALVADVLSAGSLRFDSRGHLFAGGGDFGGGDAEYFAILDALAVQTAIEGGPIVSIDDMLIDDPDIDLFSFYSARFNPITDEWLVFNFGESTIYRYALIPAPMTGIALLAGAAVVGAGGRRRRHG